MLLTRLWVTEHTPATHRADLPAFRPQAHILAAGIGPSNGITTTSFRDALRRTRPILNGTQFRTQSLGLYRLESLESLRL